ncbi:unnamed protein product [Paramecium primaurelia]|uniref:UvrD-like helicase ATP-binding domain-containing protein n=1 Tax=Paramecium primaurelia TaxID=5886 RepID=A0A8S1KZD8_PARPR|nr:unnamed protein product [Paramecium primaurelia]
MNKKNRNRSKALNSKEIDPKILNLRDKILKQTQLQIEDQQFVQNLIKDYEMKSSNLNLNDFFDGCIWKVIFIQQFISKIRDLKQYYNEIFFQIWQLSNGVFYKQDSILTKWYFLQQMQMYQVFFTSSNKEKQIILLFECAVIRKPKLDDQQFQYFQFIHTITFIDVFVKTQIKDQIINNILQEFQEQNAQDPRKQFPINLKESQVNGQFDKSGKSLNIYQLFLRNEDQNWSVFQFQNHYQKQCYWYPNIFDDIKIKNIQNLVQIDDLYLCFEEQQSIKQRELKQQRIENEQINLESLQTRSSLSQILEIVYQISEQKPLITTTDQELQVIDTNQNALVIGRSGTGKTTCTILKILSQQLLFDISQEYNLQQETKYNIVFTTSNSLLVNEMRKYFKKLITVGNSKSFYNNLDDLKRNEINQIRILLQKMNKRFSNWSIDDKQSFLNTKDNDFPAFLPINQFLLLIDKSLKNPFFQQIKINKRKIDNAGWHDNEGVFNQNILNQNENYKLNQFKTDLVCQQQFQLYEVDYEYFCHSFWMTVRKNNFNLEEEISFCNFVWCQIYSIIKGSQFSHTYPNRYLPEQVYLNYQQQQSIDQQTLQKIYSYFMLYEKWKNQQGYFDQMDLVNYIIQKIKINEYQGVSLHFLFVDEVQDFTQATLYLFNLLAEQRIMLSGDTAQNIVKGVGFRFQDLKQQFFGMKDFQTYSLTINFRSHNDILQLANNVISIIEILYPKTIDCLKKEQSADSGPKPTIISSKDINSILYLMQGQDDGKIEFGCYQAVLAKNNKDIPDILKHLIVLNIQECKGLEFDDVIIYNFFNDDSIPQNQWELLKCLTIEQIDQENKLRPKPNLQAFDIKTYSILCSELKYLYVAITRARKRIFFYDQNPNSRKYIEKIWTDLKLVNVLKFEENSEKLNKFEQVIIIKNSEKEWNDQGIKMFQLKFYEQAAKCFKYSKNQSMEYQAVAFYLASQAQQGLFKLETESSSTTHTKKNNSFHSKEYYFELFQQAGEKFIFASQLEQGAACYFSGRKYDLALKYYLQSQSWKSAITAIENLSNQQILTGILHWKCKNYERCLNCFESFGNPILFISILSFLKQQINQRLFQSKFHIWFPLLIQKLQKLKPQDLQLDLSLLKDNVPDYIQQFKGILHILYNSVKLDICYKEQLLDQIFNFVYLFQDEILILMTKIHINYNIEVSKQIMKYENQTSQFLIKLKIQLLQDIFTYYKLDQCLILLYECYNIKDQTKRFIGMFFQESNIINNGNKLQISRDPTITIFQNVPCNWTTKNYLQPTFQLCQLGFYQSGLHLVQRILSQNNLTEQQFKYCMEDQAEINYLFFQTNSLIGFDNIISQLDIYFQQEKSLGGQINNIDGFSLIESIRNKIECNQQLQEDEIQFLFLNINPLDLQQQVNPILQNKQLIAGIILLKIIVEIEKNQNHVIYQQLNSLNHFEYQHFIRFILVCIELCKYNQDLHSQIICLYSIQCVFSIRIASKLTLNQLSQSVVFIHKNSLLFKFNLVNQNVCKLIDNQKQVYQLNSKEVLNSISQYLKGFLLNYSRKYFYREQQNISKAPFLIQHFTYLRVKQKGNQNFPEGIKKFQLFQEVYYDFYLEKCVKLQIIDSLFTIISQCAEPKLILTKQMLAELSTYYFFKGLQETEIQQMHNYIMIGICIQNISHEQRLSIRFIEHLKSVQTQSFFDNYIHYINYLQITNYCLSLDACNDYFKFHDLQKEYLQPQQILKDLSLITLILTFYNANQNNVNTVLVTESSLKFLQHNLTSENYYQIQIQEQNSLEDLNSKIQKELVEKIFEQIKKQLDQRTYSIYLRLLSSIILNVVSLWDGLSERLFEMAEELEYESQDQDFQILAELVLKPIDERRNYLSPFKKLCYIHFKCTNITGKQIEDYLDTKFKKRFLESRFLDKMNFQYQEHFKNKFQNLYIGLRLILFRPLSFKNGQIVEQQIEEKVIGQLYEKIDLIRKMLLETLYSKLIDNCAHFTAITDELKLLSNLEQEVDYFISKNERQVNRKVIEPSQLLKELGQIQEQIEKWKLLNQDLNENLNLMEYSFQKQKEEEQEAYELLQKRISQILK